MAQMVDVFKQHCSIMLAFAYKSKSSPFKVTYVKSQVDRNGI